MDGTEVASDDLALVPFCRSCERHWTPVVVSRVLAQTVEAREVCRTLLPTIAGAFERCCPRMRPGVDWIGDVPYHPGIVDLLRALNRDLLLVVLDRDVGATLGEIAVGLKALGDAVEAHAEAIKAFGQAMHDMLASSNWPCDRCGRDFFAHRTGALTCNGFMLAEVEEVEDGQ